jgi:hypothetical protein
MAHPKAALGIAANLDSLSDADGKEAQGKLK